MRDSPTSTSWCFAPGSGCAEAGPSGDARARAPSLPEVPTHEEAGIKGLVLDQWLGGLVPAGTPPEIVARLNVEVGKALAEPAIRERYAQAALEPVGGTPGEFTQLVRDDYAKYGRLIRELGIKVD